MKKYILLLVCVSINKNLLNIKNIATTIQPPQPVLSLIKK